VTNSMHQELPTLFRSHQLVNLCLDVCWAYRGGMDPLALIREYPARIRSLHLRNSIGGVLSEVLGEGDIDHVALVRLLEEIGYEDWLLVGLEYEQDTEVTRAVRENLRLSVDYVGEVFGLEEATHS
jgi:sugar phosphate isomerase/epimerase